MIDAELGDNDFGMLSRLLVSSFISAVAETGCCVKIFFLMSFSGRGGGGPDDLTFAVLVELVERTEDTDRPFRGGDLASGAGRATFLEREGPV